MSVVRFRVRFLDPYGHGTTHCSDLPEHWGGPHSIKDGFWVDRELSIPKTAYELRAAGYWIPPSQLVSVEKFTEEEEQNGQEVNKEEG